MIVIDTHIFFWYAINDPRLKSGLRDRMMARPEDIYVPSACFWELLLLHKRGNFNLGPGKPDQVLREWLQVSGFKDAPMTMEIAMLSRTLTFLHEDPANRFIAATAYAYQAELATYDAQLRRLSWVKLAPLG